MTVNETGTCNAASIPEPLKKVRTRLPNQALPLSLSPTAGTAMIGCRSVDLVSMLRRHMRTWTDRTSSNGSGHGPSPASDRLQHALVGNDLVGLAGQCVEQPALHLRQFQQLPVAADLALLQVQKQVAAQDPL